MNHPADDPSRGLRRTLLACAGCFCIALAVAGALLAWTGRTTVVGAAHQAGLAEAAHDRRAGMISAAAGACAEPSAILEHVRATAQSLAAEVCRAAAGAGVPARPHGPSPADLAWSSPEGLGVYEVRFAGDDPGYRLAVPADRLSPALRVAASPGTGVARAVVRFARVGEIGAPASWGARVQAEPELRKELREGLAEDPEDTPDGWTVGALGQVAYVAPFQAPDGTRLGSVVCEAESGAVLAALDAAAARTRGVRPFLVSPEGRVLSCAGSAAELLGAPRQAATEMLDAALASAPAAARSESRVTEHSLITLAMVPIPGSPFALGTVARRVVPEPDTAGVEQAAAKAGLGVFATCLVLGLALLIAASRIAHAHDARLSPLVTVARAQARGDYASVAPDARDDELSEIASWLNTVGVRLRLAHSRVDEGDRRLTSLIESMADGFVMADAEDRITFVNQRFVDLLGRPGQALLGRYVEELLLPESLPRYRAEHARRRDKRTSRYEVQWRGGKGQHPRTIVSGVPTFDQDGRFSGSYGVVTDITEKVRVSAETARAEKLRALGGMAGGVAHDFNNVLTVILGNAQYLLLEPLPEELKQTLRVIEKSALDGTETVRRIREFTKNRTVSTSAEAVDVNRVVEEVVAAMRKRFEEEGRTRAARFQVEFVRRSRRNVRGNSHELREAITHIVQNAFEAMPRGGKLVVDAFDRGEDEVAVRVEDTGVGMTAEQQEKMFDPFYTTKDAGRCAGLGLSISYGIVRAHRGGILVKSELGRGATVTVVLPALGPAAEPPPFAAPGAGEPRVLLVGSDAAATEALQRELRALGLNVASVSSTSSAMSLLADAGIFNTLVVEHALSQSTGWELARAARAARDNLRIVLLTDADHAVNETQARNAGIDGVLSRPFDARDVHGEIYSVFVAAPAQRPRDPKLARRNAPAVKLPKDERRRTWTTEVWDPSSGARTISSQGEGRHPDDVATETGNGAAALAAINDPDFVVTQAADDLDQLDQTRSAPSRGRDSRPSSEP